MRELIAWLLVGVSVIGLIYCIVLIFTFIALPKDDEYLDDFECDCIRCRHE